MTILIVYYLDGQWFGEVVDWKRSGTGFYRELTRVVLPQSKAEIEKYAAENHYKISWRGEIPAESASAAASV
jgi:hypothetical protein